MNILYLYCMFILFIGQSLVPKQPVVIDQNWPFGAPILGHSQAIKQKKRIRYPLVNVYIAMENHHFLMGKSTISMAIFNSYVKLPEGISTPGNHF